LIARAPGRNVFSWRRESLGARSGALFRTWSTMPNRRPRPISFLRRATPFDPTGAGNNLPLGRARAGFSFATAIDNLGQIVSQQGE